MARQTAQDGFTLVEVLVALAVFAIAAIGLIQVSSETVTGARYAESRVLAEIVAENQMAEAVLLRGDLPVGAATGRSVQRGETLEWTRLVGPSTREDLLSISITVTAAEGGQVLTRLESLVRRPS